MGLLRVSTGLNKKRIFVFETLFASIYKTAQEKFRSLFKSTINKAKFERRLVF